MTKAVKKHKEPAPEASVPETPVPPTPPAVPVGEPGSGFRPLKLNRPLMEAIAAAGYVNPSPIQAELIPVAMQGKDVIGQSQTGTGKTAAFLLPFMNAWRGGDPMHPQAMVLCPTRELAVQVGAEASKLAPSKHFRTVVCYGGQKFSLQQTQLNRGCTLMVGTPGRVFDHLSRGTISLDKIKYVVLDEADQMLDIGFRPQIERIMRRAPRNRQTLLLSATLPAPVMKLAEKYQVDPVNIKITPEAPTVDRISQSYFTVDEHRKFELLCKVLTREKPRQCIIFVERKRTADHLYRDLHKEFASVNVTHGDLDQRKREKIMADFRAEKIHVLIATNVMSRGIDVTGISHIINFDLPQDIESYVHRIGRTGRMGRDGKALSFVTPEQGGTLTDIENMINRLIDVDHMDGFEAFEKRVKAVPAEKKATVPVFGRRNKKYSKRL